MPHSRRLFVAALAASFAAHPAIAQTTPAATGAPSIPAPPSEVEIGKTAPDFTMEWADSAGVRSAPVKLSDLRGKVVVLAFYPADRSSGCTAELTKFRDEYDRLFGSGVVVVPISGDSISTHASWAKEMKFPYALAADPSLDIARQYGSYSPERNKATRTIFVIGKDGTIRWRNLRFGALSENAYTELAAEVAKAR